jgi:hypothetical protein
VKQDTDPNEKFEWDMTVVILIVLAVFLALVAMAVWPIHHSFGREP